MLMEGDPFCLIEGMAIAGLAVGATKGFVYLRSEYPHAFAHAGRGHRDRREGGAARAVGAGLRQTLRARGAARRRSVYLRRGDLAAGKPGRQARAGPRQAAAAGAEGPLRQAHGRQQRASRSPPCRGSWTHGAAGLCRLRHGPFARHAARAARRQYQARRPRRTRLRPHACASSSRSSAAARASGRPVRAVQVGGPLGAYFPDSLLDTPLDYEALAAVKGMLGHGGIVVFDDTRRHGEAGAFRDGVLRHRKLRQVHALPHRLHARRRGDRPDRRRASTGRRTRVLLDDLLTLMTDASLCALGGLTPLPVQSALTHFPEDFDRPARGDAACGRPSEEAIDGPRSRNSTTARPIRVADRTVTPRHRRPDGHRAGRHLRDGGGDRCMGTQIPKLCATDMLEPFGSCRLCLVEIEGRKGTPASCTTPVEAGMVVRTQTRSPGQAAQGRDGALHLRPPARLPDLRGQWRLRAAGHGGRGWPARGALRLRGREPS